MLPLSAFDPLSFDDGDPHLQPVALRSRALHLHPRGALHVIDGGGAQTPPRPPRLCLVSDTQRPLAGGSPPAA